MKKKKNTIKKAVALSYREEYGAPRVIGKGAGGLAEKVLKIGKKKGIEIYEDKDLVEDLFRIDVDEKIPHELYAVVSQVIAFVYLLDREKGEGYER